MQDFLSLAEVAERLAISKSRLYRLIAAGQVPACNVCGKLRIPAKAFEAFIQDRERAALASAGLETTSECQR